MFNKTVLTWLCIVMAGFSAGPLFVKKINNNNEASIIMDNNNPPEKEKEQEQDIITLIDDFSNAVARRINSRWRAEEEAILNDPTIREARNLQLVASLNSIAKAKGSTVRYGRYPDLNPIEEDNIRKGQLASLDSEVTGNEDSKYSTSMSTKKVKNVDKTLLVQNTNEGNDVLTDGIEMVQDIIDALPTLIQVPQNEDNSSPDNVPDIADPLR